MLLQNKSIIIILVFFALLVNGSLHNRSNEPDTKCMEYVQDRLKVYVPECRSCDGVCNNVEFQIYLECLKSSSGACKKSMEKCWVKNKFGYDSNVCSFCLAGIFEGEYKKHYYPYRLHYKDHIMGQIKGKEKRCHCNYGRVSRSIRHGDLKKLKDMGLDINLLN